MTSITPPPMLAVSNLHALDIAIIAVVMSIVVVTGIVTKRHTRSVADFLSANRCAGRYLLTVASGMAMLGAISIVAQWEQVYQAGFSGQFWGQMLAPIALVLALSGWIIYRYRESRAMTLAQFMEMRYSRRFRIFSGTLCWVSGVLNYGIFPAVTARFLIYFLGLPVLTWQAPFGGPELNLTLGAVMAVELALAAVITLSGGQIAVMVTDFIQGQLSNIVMLALLGVMLFLFPWPLIAETLAKAPPGKSMLNPFDIRSLPDFDISFFMIMLFISVYNYMVWQGTQGYNSSARSPHEAKMAGILAQLRMGVSYMMMPFAAICAFVMMNAPSHETAALTAQATLDGIGDPQIAKQMTTTVALTHMLPVGVMGLFAAVMIMAAVSTDSTYLHSWGSILVQDVLLPWRQLRGKSAHLTPQQHLRWLKRSILGVSIFAWCFSMVFPLKEFILMYFLATAAIFTGGAGSVLVGGLYWKRGTTSGAWAAMIVGSVLAVSGILIINVLWPQWVPSLQARWPDVSWIAMLPEKFWLNGWEMGFVASLSSVAAYVGVSLLSPDSGINFDKLLHRGPWSKLEPEGPDHTEPPVRGWAALGITAEFTRRDKFIYWLNFSWVAFFFIAFVVICLWQWFEKWPDAWWANWWLFNLSLTVVAGTLMTVWFLIGGIQDLKALFRSLSSIRRDDHDDGTVEK